MKTLLDLFFTFCRIGGLTFGGGYAMLPMIQKEIVEEKKWATESEVLDYYAVGQCTPGIIAVNTATFIGYRVQGITGAIVATLGVVFPSLIIITIIASLLKNFAQYALVQYAFSGIRVVVIALIINAIIKLAKTSIKSSVTLLIAIAAFALVAFIDLSPIYIVLVAGCIGLISKFIRGKH